jgi:hypothetical protein
VSLIVITRLELHSEGFPSICQELKVTMMIKEIFPYMMERNSKIIIALMMVIAAVWKGMFVHLLIFVGHC